MKSYKHIFFDLDRTLWDLEKNSTETLKELHDRHRLVELGIPYGQFFSVYRTINDKMWKYYTLGEITKNVLRFGRFHKTFLEFGVNNIHLAKKFGEDYAAHAPYKKNLFPGTLEVLARLKINYSLHIITNGFEEVQHIKIKHSGLHPYFIHIVTSERAGAQKPSPRVFEYAVSLAGATKEKCIMVGDNYEQDIIGARNAGIDQVYFNAYGDRPGKQCTHEISSLRELLVFL